MYRNITSSHTFLHCATVSSFNKQKRNTSRLFLKHYDYLREISVNQNILA